MNQTADPAPKPVPGRATPPPRPPAAAPTHPDPDDVEASPRRGSCLGAIFWRNRPGEALWNLASIISMTVNVVLLAVLLIIGRELFVLKNLVEGQLIGGLYENFVKMDQAHIVTTIQVQDTIIVKDTIPVVFDLPLNQETTVVLTKDTPVKNATVYLNNSPVTTNITLRKGTPLNIALSLVVPVNQMLPVELKVPVNLQVPVDIALEQTDLHEPFVGLQDVLSPYRSLLGELPSSAAELPCGPFKSLCNWYFK